MQTVKYVPPAIFASPLHYMCVQSSYRHFGWRTTSASVNACLVPDTAQWYAMVHVQQHEHFNVPFIVLHCNFSPQPSALYIQPYLQYTLDNDQRLTVMKAAQSLWTYYSFELSARRYTLAYLILPFSESCLRKYGPPPTWDEKIRKKYIHAPNGI